MTRRAELPHPFDQSPFRVGDARAQGITRKRLDARDLQRLHHGSRSRPAVGLHARCEALVPLMSATQAFTGPTAAVLLDLPMPSWTERDGRLHVSSLRPQRAMRRPDVVGSERGRGDVGRVDGLPILSPEAVWISLCSLLPVADLVAVGDRLVTGTLRDAPCSSLDLLIETVEAARGHLGAQRARAAMKRIRVGAWSRPESLLRLLIEDAGLPPPELNEPVDLGSGRVVIPDLAWPDYRVAVEYDGAWHAGRWGADSVRHEQMVDAGWVVVRVIGSELFGSPSEVIGRLVRRLTERGYRHPRSIDLTRMTRFTA